MKQLPLLRLLALAALTACSGESPVAGGSTSTPGGSDAGGDPTSTGGGNGTSTSMGGDSSSTGTTTTGTTTTGTTGTTTTGTTTTGTTTTGSTTSMGGAGGTMTTPMGGRAPLLTERYDDIDGGVDDTELYGLFIETFEYAAALACVCEGFDANSCVANIIGTKNFLEQQCEEEVLFADANGKALVECRLRAEEDYIFCSYPETGPICEVSCETTYSAALGECPELEDATWIDLEERCYGREPFTCDGGDTVLPRFRVCDMETDCADSTDEVIATCNEQAAQ